MFCFGSLSKAIKVTASSTITVSTITSIFLVYLQSSLGTTDIDTNDKLFTNQARVVSTASWFLTPVDKINPALFGMQASCQIIF